MYLDIEEIKSHLPKSLSRSVTPEFIATLNKMIDSVEFGENYARNAITYTSVLQTGKYRLVDYFNAVAYLSHKALGDPNYIAFSKVFPDRYKRILAKYGDDQKQIASSISAYNRSKLVVSLTEQMLVPDYIAYASVRHEAIKTQANLLRSKNEHVVQKAANSLMEHLKAPAQTNVAVSIPAMDTGVITDLANALSALSDKQAQTIIEGTCDASTIAQSQLLPQAEE